MCIPDAEGKRTPDPEDYPPEVTFTKFMALLYDVGRMTYLKDLIMMDEITRAMLHVITHENLPMWVTFAMAALLDVYVVLEETHERPFSEYQSTAKDVLSDKSP
ncbi:hypothetical protein BU23DRAFT_278798 [Bimuria novae-zelandiae CBS 107.79]|uniref:Uncharacterized protein n=1 Tax=Bimuria novae-zelandiae CBS 107.79 TaxID=1447943 RepID=A0A6A5US87_9PLEO|nr:hypothetical protein BU23DRAFT_278798 [Bimuria novae-zelandiae CBS 107.79]